MRIATWNVNSLKVRLPHVLDWLEQQRPDVLALQETKLIDEAFPVEALAEAGYQAVFAGQKTYNGVALLSKTQAMDPMTDPPGVESVDRRIMAATVDGVRVVNLYVVNGSEVGSDKYAYKLEWLHRVTAFLRAEQAQHEHVVVLGDFNIAPEDRDVYDPEAWHERILCSTPEREALKAILDMGFVDVFRRFEQPDPSYSWWDYRAARFRRNQGLRIDLILATTALAGQCTASMIDTAPRKLERPSDHAPVVADFHL
ncbi:exodeoxyribonuclease III [Ectothiorhodospira haloalkaliphila]|uniref:Exodeoxyribonuclease III n=1 Tax=Ectothiorhodospira haloalkaliphila TaxID=421628 RepID=W8KDL3_9GAMM|nr:MULTISPECIES: exodeoxyribonuclease III [Ectothiorhodospira]AHK77869.1 exodeoxyribonuclease III [Ectothiorhodospira haloalkaliphila]MCG5495011.1 exodeoxyribonuclease III [Ectothiorhodospira variabilis]MCG5496354.1 exodeoxyribonuclease III [Ectothiorhodospira variabilis]MCG5504524.1 exodeoxyribonuclease III [Ectothiorhodospira variabilis]MCG5507610.1 exodeoxyribonuclease III [Ectothiorhodospira variabilis]